MLSLFHLFLSVTLLATSIITTTAKSATDNNDGILLWEAYADPIVQCYRQPLLIKTPSALLAFAEGRPGIPYCSGTFYPTSPDFPIVLRTSLDNGVTWSNASELVRGNLDFLVAVYDPIFMRVNLLVQQGDTGTIQLSSSDDGLSWSNPTSILINAPAGIYASLIPGVGHGLSIKSQYCMEVTCGGSYGRLILPFVATRDGPVSNDTACGSCATALVYSDDGGSSWTLGAVSEQNGSREAALVQLNSNDYSTLSAVIYAGERNLGNATGTRLHAISKDSGFTFSTFGTDPSLPDVVTGNWTGVVAGLVRVDSMSDATAATTATSGVLLAFTAPAAIDQRANLSLWISVDGGKSWPSASLASVWPGPSAYSDMIMINSTHIGVLFESSSVAAPTEFAGGIRFISFPASQLL
jgi:sialidase-1